MGSLQVPAPIKVAVIAAAVTAPIKEAVEAVVTKKEVTKEEVVVKAPAKKNFFGKLFAPETYIGTLDSTKGVKEAEFDTNMDSMDEAEEEEDVTK
eukprot:CAMPEP_0198215282 /NCGR_PEP_ID=MMETSP1445-20131203/48509_1 /TAXON_ID=36898 /ORGANISM="Pyramimonas sp., Strain CCMP2087" /LENGTH=94 /DNA_ID=CAMNT_0043890925 /DNA_START=137 /DNA_END=418 /DNA_ORIENTATION=-